MPKSNGASAFLFHPISTKNQSKAAMLKRFLSLLTLLCSLQSLLSQATIEEARNFSLGSEVTVIGIVTNGEELGIIRYLQDETAGIAAYPGSGSVDGFDVVQAGDLISVTGVLVEFQGLLELSPVTAFSILSSNNALPEPVLVQPQEIGEALESQLVRLECNTFAQGGVFQGNNLYSVNHYTGSASNVYIGNNHPLAGTGIPSNSVDIVAIASQFNSYQLLVRGASDLTVAPCFFITEGPRVSVIEQNSLEIQWTTNAPGNSTVRYGTTPSMDDNSTESVNTTNHSVTLQGLTPATIYYVQVESNNGSVTASSPMRIFSTASNSTGSIEIYFNNSTDPSFSTGLFANGVGPVATEDYLLQRIDEAQQTIDVAMYNTTRDWLVDALEEAEDRGVRVRYIADDQTSNPAFDQLPSFPVVFGNPGDPLMHNKFFVIDEALEDDSYVITGSMNLTFGDVFESFNNVLSIQDQALARAYTIEFEEMWGSTGAMPNPANAKFGANKSYNTPTQFSIGGKAIECYFSPSDGTNKAIQDALNSSTSSIDFALLLITMDELAAALKDANFAGRQVRGLVESINEPNSDFFFLQSQGVDVRAHSLDGILHHKYGLIDAVDPNATDPKVITGSHNWTFSAENFNDENTLIIHDAAITNVFLQEFEARWADVVAVSELPSLPVMHIFPNPAVDQFTIQAGEPVQERVHVRLCNAMGQVLRQVVLEPGQATTQIGTAELPAGLYQVVFQGAGGMASAVMTILK